MKVETGQGKYQFSLIESHMILWKYRARSGGSDYLELSPRSLYCECTIGLDGSKIKRQMKKLSRRESWEIKEKMKKIEIMMLMDREMKEK